MSDLDIWQNVMLVSLCFIVLFEKMTENSRLERWHTMRELSRKK